MDIKSRFGKTIRLFRKKRGITQEKLGELSGLHTNYIGGMERGERNPSLETINKITRALDLSLSDTFAGIDGPEQARETPLPYSADISPEDSEFLKDLFQKLIEWKKGSS